MTYKLLFAFLALVALPLLPATADDPKKRPPVDTASLLAEMEREEREKRAKQDKPDKPDSSMETSSDDTQDDPAGKKEKAEEPFASQKWSKEDVIKYCSHGNSGPRSYDNCVARNERRIGRLKTSYDNQLIRDNE